jgi:thimet oligopeptidase
MVKTLKVALGLLLSSALTTAFAANLQPKDPTGRSFTQQQEARVKQVDQLLTQILDVEGQRTVANTLRPYREMMVVLGNAFSEASVFSNTHPDKAIREAAFKNLQDISKMATEKIELNRDLYDALAAVKLGKVDPELKRYYDDMIQEYKRSGVNRDAATRKKIADLRQAITEASQTFSKNLREDVRFILVKPDDLKGLPEDYIKARLNDDGYVKITTDYPDSGPVYNYAESQAIRRRLYVMSRSRGYPQNQKPLQTVLAKRYELAKLLGYKNYAEYATENKMVKSPERVASFIEEVAGIAQVRAKQDYAALLKEKKKRQASADEVFEWERSFLVNLYKKNNIGFDPQQVRPYFAYDRVKDGVFQISEKLFGIDIRPLKGGKAWHDEVGVYEVYDGDQLLGRFYLDMHPRENKYKHAAQFTLRSGYDGIQLPEAVLICNFPRPSSSDPALMEQGQVETFLHEFGHLLHSIFRGHNRWPSSLEWDFIEAPSQLLEEWVWDEKALDLFAKHYKTGKPLSSDLIAKMNAAKKVSLGINTAVQLHYAKLSLELYNQNPEGLDILAVNKKIKKQLSPFSYTEGTYFPYNFGHLTGYASNYYTYQWSSVIAKDMFSRFDKKGIFSPVVAQKYREQVLAASGRKGANELVADFLGRPYNFQAFKSWLTEDVNDI